MCVSMCRCSICGSLCVQICDSGRVHVFVMDKRTGLLGVCALARAERYDGIDYLKEQSGFWTQQVLYVCKTVSVKYRLLGLR